MAMDLAAIQKYIGNEGLDGWLVYDFRGLNPFAQGMSPFKGIVTRRWFLLIPRGGRPVALIHRIEESSFVADWAERRSYSGWKELAGELGRLLGGSRRVAMEYSPENAIPYVSKVDGGTLELVRAAGAEVVSSANLIQHFQARWSTEGLTTHKEAADFLVGLVRQMFAFTAGEVAAGRAINEYDVQQEILRRFEAAGMIWEEPPIVAVGPHAAMPHYAPSGDIHSPVKRGDLLLLDVFCRRRGENTISADITWTAYVGPEPVPEKIREIFSVVSAARDRGVKFIRDRIESGREVKGWEVDDAVRGVIARAGYGDFFTHRTGHSLGVAIHSNGVNIDNLETRDDRVLEPGLGFTIEPGIYLPGEFGIRSEINCHVSETDLEVTTLPLQDRVQALL